MNLLVIGATGLVGKSFISLLERKKVDLNITFVASEKNLNNEIIYNNTAYKLKIFDDIDLTKIDVACIMTSSEVSQKYTPRLLYKNIVVIDNSSAYRKLHNITIPELNFEKNQELYVNPNCCVIQSLIPLYHLNKEFNITKIIFNTYQSCSGGGSTLLNNLYNNKMPNCIPLIGEKCKSGNTTEEEKLIYETQKILNKTINITANCVRVPIEKNHLVNIIFETKKDIDITEILSTITTHTIYNKKNTFHNLTYDENIYTYRLKKVGSNTYSFYTYANNLLRGSSYNTFLILMNVLKTA